MWVHNITFHAKIHTSHRFITDHDLVDLSMFTSEKFTLDSATFEFHWRSSDGLLFLVSIGRHIAALQLWALWIVLYWDSRTRWVSLQFWRQYVMLCDGTGATVETVKCWRGKLCELISVLRSSHFVFFLFSQPSLMITQHVFSQRLSTFCPVQTNHESQIMNHESWIPNPESRIPNPNRTPQSVNTDPCMLPSVCHFTLQVRSLCLSTQRNKSEGSAGFDGNLRPGRRHLKAGWFWWWCFCSILCLQTFVLNVKCPWLPPFLWFDPVWFYWP